MINTIISGGQVVTPWGVGDWDVAIEGENLVCASGKIPRFLSSHC